MSVKGEMASLRVDQIKFENPTKDPKDFARIYEMLVVTEDLLMNGDPSGVKGMCSAILKIRPDVSRAHEFLGAVTGYEEGDQRQNHFLLALRYDSGSTVAHFSLGNVQARKGDLQLAERHFREAVYLANREDLPKDSLVKSLTSFGYFPPMMFKTTLHLADTLRELRRLEDATQTYYDALYLDTLVPDSPQIQQVKAEAFTRLGEILGWQQRYDDAINAHQDALALSPGMKAALRGINIILNGQAMAESVKPKKDEDAEEND